MTGGGDEGDSVRDEFVAEAQEIIEALSRDLLLLDHGQKEGNPDPDLVNSVFRGVHTLKGIAGMFGFADLGEVAHVLEDLLDQLRLGRVELTQEVLDVLFEGVEVLQRLLSAGPEAPEADLDGFRGAVQAVLDLGEEAPSDFGAYDLDTGVLSVLTEYEEHRLRTNIDQGVPLYRLRVRFGLTSIDSDLEELKARAKPIAEIITYLPSMEGGDDDSIDLEVLLASRVDVAELRDALCTASDAELEPVGSRGAGASGHTMTPPPPDEPTTSHPPASPPAAPKRAEERTGAPPAPPRDVGADSLSVRSVAKTVRVDIGKLDHLMNVVGELAIIRSGVGRVLDRVRGNPEFRALATELHRIHRGFERHLDDLQDGILDVRMVPLGQTFDRLARAVRQVSREHGKDVRLQVSGADTEVDKLIVEELTDPLLHIIRNAIDHGIETSSDREAAGKPATGTLALNAYQKGNHVVIEVEDDGSGMDAERILASAVERGAITVEAGEEMQRPEKLGLIFLPGVSTAEAITDLSGRGVGMDVVKTHIARLGGVVDVHSELGIGTKFTITLPITLAIISALVVRVAGRTYCIPLTVVQEALVLDPASVRRVEGHEVITLRGATLPICRLDGLFGLQQPAGASPKEYVVVTSLGQRRLGLVVQGLEGQQDIIIKPLGKTLSDVKGFAGATDLGDQRVVLVLDAPSLLEEVLAGPEVRAAGLGATS
ncbi:MAG TPA: chemotaxis protein CheA [Sandaracinaceae bacterium LLY-WYZ-13_1]|nr:chemotaxis protein CheA [Sandaracinaceae bacterium LLY-WYZ-13_1]